MTSWFVRGMLAAAIALPALSGPAQADNDKCSNATLKGDYATRIQGKLLGIVTAAGPQIFPDPLLVDGVAMARFDGKGKFTQVDYVLRDGVQNPGPKDPETGFGINETGTYTVFSDCTGQFELNPSPVVLIEVKFVVAEQGRQLYGIESRQLVAKGIAVGSIVCDKAAGCEVLPQLHSDGTKLQAGQGNKH
jgi:hypothetical protein